MLSRQNVAGQPHRWALQRSTSSNLMHKVSRKEGCFLEETQRYEPESSVSLSSYVDTDGYGSAIKAIFSISSCLITSYIKLRAAESSDTGISRKSTLEKLRKNLTL